MDLEIGYGEALQFGVKQGIYTRRGSISELETLRQRVQELEKDCDEYHQVAMNHIHANEKLTAERDELLALVVEARATLEMWKDVAPAVSLCADLDKAIASVKEKA